MKRTTKAAATILIAGCMACACALTACGSVALDPNTIFSDTSGVTVSGKKVSFPEKHQAKTFKDGTTTEGFSVTYTVKGDRQDYLWVNSGGLYVEQTNGLWYNIVIFHTPWRDAVNENAFAQVWIVQGSTDPEDEEGNAFAQDSTGASYTTALPFSVSSNPITVEIAYYQSAYYIRLDHTVSVKIDDSSNIENSIRIDTEKFFSEGERRLGFRTAETPATFSNINYEIGNEAALKAIKRMGLSVD